MRLALCLLSVTLGVGGCDDAVSPDAEHERDMQASRVDAAQPREMGQPRDMTPVFDAATPGDTGFTDAMAPLPSPCPPERGMIGIPFPDGTCSLMDPDLVTRGAFRALQARAPLVTNDPACEYSYGQAPRLSRSGDSATVCSFADEGEGVVLWNNPLPWPPSPEEAELPMICLNWCDAEAYCKAAGKRLCTNRRVQSGETISLEVLSDPSADELMNACTAGGTRLFPYGDQLRLLPFAEMAYLDPGRWHWEGGYAGLRSIGFGSEFGRRPATLLTIDWTSGAPCTPWLRTSRPQNLEALLSSHLGGFRCCADSESLWR